MAILLGLSVALKHYGGFLRDIILLRIQLYYKLKLIFLDPILSF